MTPVPYIDCSAVLIRTKAAGASSTPDPFASIEFDDAAVRRAAQPFPV